MNVSFPSALPSVLTPGVATPVTARIVGVGQGLVGGSPTLHVRYDGGSFLALPMAALGGDLFQASLPPAVCTATPEFYFSAQGTTSGIGTNPSIAPAELFQAFVTSVAPVFTDHFETDLGWTVTNVALTDGAWDRGVPAGLGDRNDPIHAWGGSGQCYLTDNVAGNSDVDGGPTRLTSPTLNLSAAGQYQITYARWISSSILDDTLVVEISNNNGTNWTTVETVAGTAAVSGWVERSIDVATFVAPSAQVRMRFSATDTGTASVAEAGLDAFRVERRTCDALPDCNANGILDTDDIASGRSNDVNNDTVPDECQPAPPKWKQKGPTPPVVPG